MKSPRRNRLYMVLGILVGVAVAAGLTLQALRHSVGYVDPTHVVAGDVAIGKRFQLGGMVLPGSVRREAGSLEVRFVVTDFHSQVPVRYTGVLPDLFKENKGVTANGRLNDRQEFIADEVLAKHDENYMPPAVGKSLKKGESRMAQEQGK